MNEIKPYVPVKPKQSAKKILELVLTIIAISGFIFIVLPIIAIMILCSSY